MPYYNPTQINRQQALSQQLRAQPYERRGSALSGLAHMLRQWGAGRGDALADQKLQANDDLKKQEMQSLISALQGSKVVDPSTFEHPDTQGLYAGSVIAQQLAKSKANSTTPSNIQEWNVYQQMSPEQQEQFLNMKRASKVINLGDRQVIPAMTNPGQVAASYNVELKPSDLPENAAAKAEAVEQAKADVKIETTPDIEAAKVVGKDQGAKQSELADRTSSLPRLEQVVTELSELGHKATYTKAGQLKDTITRELGMDVGEGAIARKEYISKVDNEILPLLRQTFGAQFTEREGQSLKATLGDPDASPAEKDAVLRSFIATKKAQIQKLETELDDDSLINKYLQQ